VHPAWTLRLCAADSGLPFAGGTGEPNDPYLITTKEQLLAIPNSTVLPGKCFKLVSDLDLAGVDSPKGVIRTFSGTFDGNGHAIRNLTLTRSGDLGLFGTVQSGGRVLNLSMTDVSITGKSYAGALAGQNAGTIQNCNSTGSVTTSAPSLFGAGGLVGFNKGTMTHCRSTATVEGVESVGGLVGSSSGTISDCASTGFASGSYSVGSLVGSNSGTLSTSHSDGPARGYSEAGGLVGYNTGIVTNCYSTRSASGNNSVGGLVGNNAGRLSCCYTTATVTSSSASCSSIGYVVGTGTNVTACYYVPLNAISGTSVNAAGISLTAEEMKRQASFVGWDFWGTSSDGVADAWFMPPGAFPVFAGQTDITGLVAVPDVAGLSLDQAKARLATAGLAAGTVTQDYHRTLPVGTIIWAYPHFLALPGGTIDLILSRGATCDWAQNSGDGSTFNPYRIQSPGQLESLGDHSELWDKCFTLTADLNMSGRTYPAALIAPDVDSQAGFQGLTFTGSFDGSTHAIWNLLISGDSSAPGTCFGLFGMIDSTGLISSLNLRNVAVTTGTTTSTAYVGTLAGVNAGTITGCSSDGTLLTTSNAVAGGLVGSNRGSMVDCTTSAAVTRSKQN
jgi:hypothetical protein